MATILKDTTLVPVRNMVDHKVVYIIPDQNRRVVFEPFQEKRVTAGELRQLNYSTGGEVLIHNYLCVKSNDLRIEFNIPEDLIEYDWTLDDIHRVLEDLSSPIEALEDALDFAPEGIKELIVDCAVDWKIPDSNRRKVISRMTGVDIDKKIKMLEEIEKVSGEKAPKTSHRRLNNNTPTRTGRRIQN